VFCGGLFEVAAQDGADVDEQTALLICLLIVIVVLLVLECHCFTSFTQLLRTIVTPVVAVKLSENIIHQQFAYSFPRRAVLRRGPLAIPVGQ
jgi:hypothetical protein